MTAISPRISTHTIALVKDALQWSARAMSKDGMTGISDERAERLAFDVITTLQREGVIPSLDTVAAGTVAVSRHDPEHRVVVYRVDKAGSVYYDSISEPRRGSGAICYGHASTARFLESFEPTGRMRFNGAWQMVMRERARRHALRREIHALLRRLP